MLRRSLFVSALILAGVVGFASSAKAAEQPVTFTTTITAGCNLTAPVTGSLEGTLALENGSTTKLVTATAARIGVDCGTGKLKVSAPVLSTAPTGYTATPVNTVKITTKSGQTTSTPGNEVTLVAADKGDALIEMTSSNGTTDFPAGSYEYTVMVTATP